MFGQWGHALRNIGWGVDWLVKAHITASDTPAANVFVGQVGAGAASTAAVEVAHTVSRGKSSQSAYKSCSTQRAGAGSFLCFALFASNTSLHHPGWLTFLCPHLLPAPVCVCRALRRCAVALSRSALTKTTATLAGLSTTQRSAQCTWSTHRPVVPTLLAPMQLLLRPVLFCLGRPATPAMLLPCSRGQSRPLRSPWCLHTRRSESPRAGTMMAACRVKGTLHGLFESRCSHLLISGSQNTWCLCAVLCSAVTQPQAIFSTGHMPGTAGRHMWHGLLHTCAGTRPPTAPLLSSGGTQLAPPWAQALGEWVLLCPVVCEPSFWHQATTVDKDGRVLPVMLLQAVERA